MRREGRWDRLALLGGAAGLLFWVAASAMESYLFGRGPIAERLFAPGLEDAAGRLVAALLLLLLGLCAELRLARRPDAPAPVDKGPARTSGLGQAALPRESPRRPMEQELESARVIQQSFLPGRRLPSEGDPRVELAATNLPASSVGGDYYDVLLHGRDRLSLVLGDVSGKGIPAAIYMARLVSDFRFVVDPYKGSPAQTLSSLNRHLVRRGHAGMFITLLYLVVDLNSGVVTFANAGHAPVLVRRAGGEVELVDGAAGPPLGVVENQSYRDAEFPLFPGNDLLLYTDGVSEAMNLAREVFSRARLVEVVRAAPEGAEAVVEAVVEAVRGFTAGAPIHDDITLLAARWRGADRARW